MNSPLIYEYRSGWREAASEFRLHQGMQVVRKRLEGQFARHLAVALLLDFTCVALLFTKAWPFTLALVIPSYSKSRFALHLARSTRQAKFGLRQTFRETPTRDIKLTVTDTGLHELDNGIESNCPWSAVRHYTYESGTLSLHLANGLRAQLPEARLREGSSSVAALVQKCKENHIPFK